MLDLQFICEHRDQVIDNCLKRGVTVDVDAVALTQKDENAREGVARDPQDELDVRLSRTSLGETRRRHL